MNRKLTFKELFPNEWSVFMLKRKLRHVSDDELDKLDQYLIESAKLFTNSTRNKRDWNEIREDRSFFNPTFARRAWSIFKWIYKEKFRRRVTKQKIWEIEEIARKKTAVAAHVDKFFQREVEDDDPDPNTQQLEKKT